MKDKETLNKIYEMVYDKKVPEREKFIEKYNRLDDTIKEQPKKEKKND
jgi:hypothetical protein